MWRGFAQVPRSACLWRHRPPYPWPRAAPLLCSPVPWWLQHWPELGWPLQWGGELKWVVREILMWEDGRGFHSKCSGVSELLHKRYIDTSVGRKRSSPSVSWTHKMLDVSRHLSCKLCSGGRMSQKQHTLHTSACSYDRVTSISRLELETKIIRMFQKISQKRPLLGPGVFWPPVHYDNCVHLL